MSIITEALRKAEKERNVNIPSGAYIDKILGPKIDVSMSPVLTLKHSSHAQEKQPDPSQKRKMIFSAGILITIFIVFLSFINIFIFSTIDNTGATDYSGKTQADLGVAEAYSTDDEMRRDLALIDKKSNFLNTVTRSFRGITLKEAFLSKFKLNGIVYDTDNSWAVINNKMLKEGEIINGATLVAIRPEKVVMFYQDESFDLLSQ